MADSPRLPAAGAREGAETTASAVVAGAWVLVHDVVLPAGSRAPGIPSETQAVPLEMRVKGFLVGEPASPGQRVTVRTLTGRMVSGALVAANPIIPHTFGSPVPELLAVGPELRGRLRAVAGDGEDASRRDQAVPGAKTADRGATGSKSPSSRGSGRL